MKTVTVVHLVWPPLGIEPFKRFLDSYEQHKAGYTHDLAILFNGLISTHERKLYYQILRSRQIKFSSYVRNRNGIDLSAYLWVAGKITTDYILFLNSHSEILADNWLAKYMAATSIDRVGVVSATCSFQSHYSTLVDECTGWDKTKSIWKNICRYKYLVKKYLKYKSQYRPFPNPHFRSNGFLIATDLFKSFKVPIRSKDDAYRLESGIGGMSDKVRQQGLKILMIDKDGLVYPQQRWNGANIFWQGEQENLLIADNQTRNYFTNKQRYNFLAYGTELTDHVSISRIAAKKETAN